MSRYLRWSGTEHREPTRIVVMILKLLEERELAERFGEAYLAYKRSTPFIVPRLLRR